MMSLRLVALALGLLGLVEGAEGEQNDDVLVFDSRYHEMQIVEKKKYDIICDAGSTGTRMYLFTSTFYLDADGKETLKVATEVIGKKKPGLSAYADDAGKAVPPLLQLFGKVRAKIPHDHWPSTTVTVLGTAGMRSVDPAKRQPIYDALRAGFAASEEYVFSKEQLLQLRSLTGTEEGTFSLLCVNFLTGRLDHHLAPTKTSPENKLLGILDLGGSSTQIAVPSGDVSDLQNAAAVRSYAAYGMEQMRGKLDLHAAGNGMSSSPCYFKGQPVVVDTVAPPHNLQGSGEAQKCREMLTEVWSNSKQACASGDDECMPGHDDVAKSAGLKGFQFFAVSGYLFVTDFASHWLQRSGTPSGATLKEVGNRPTIIELEAAADELCASDWAAIETAHAGGAEAGAHRYTDASKAPHRCLEVNYVTTLLRNYGFPADQRLVSFEDEVDENAVEWPLGALLHMRHQAAPGKNELGVQAPPGKNEL